MQTSRCPLCEQANQCSVDSDTCWCKQPPMLNGIPAALRELVATDQRARCVCQACVERFKANPASFVAQHSRRASH